MTGATFSKVTLAQRQDLQQSQRIREGARKISSEFYLKYSLFSSRPGLGILWARCHIDAWSAYEMQNLRYKHATTYYQNS